MVAHVVHVDRYGNAALDLDHDQLPDTGLTARPPRCGWGRDGVTLEACTAHLHRRGPPGQLMLYEDSYRSLALAVNRGNAAEVLDVTS